jgi:ribonuclease HI
VELTSTPSDKKQIAIYCDGSCVPNPGTMGIGIVYQKIEHAFSACLGGGTNQIAELFALYAAIEFADVGDFIFTDSMYAIKIARCDWRAHCYQDLVLLIRNSLIEKRIRLRWVEGHSGHLLQQRADRVAYRAARKRRPRIEPQVVSVSAWVARCQAALTRDPVGREGLQTVDQADVGFTSGRSGEHAELGSVSES